MELKDSRGLFRRKFEVGSNRGEQWEYIIREMTKLPSSKVHMKKSEKYILGKTKPLLVGQTAFRQAFKLNYTLSGHPVTGIYRPLTHLHFFMLLKICIRKLPTKDYILQNNIQFSQRYDFNNLLVLLYCYRNSSLLKEKIFIKQLNFKSISGLVFLIFNE